MLLKDAICVKAFQMISLVGAGGKTSFIFSLAKELAETDKKVLISTTTKMNIPRTQDGGELIVERSIERILGESGLIEHGIITWAWGKTSDGKITGVLPEYLDVIHGQKKFDFILVEADGSKQKPLKAPAVYEPVIPKRTSIVLGLMGIDAMGKPLDGKNVHRPENIEDITGRPIGSVIDVEIMAQIALHDQGLFKNSGKATTKILVLNKVDNDAAISAALTLARTVKERVESEGAYVRRYGRINRVILTSIKKKNPVIYILDI